MAPNGASPSNHRWTQYCPECGYNLRGLTGTRCPECGRQFDRSQLPLVDEHAPPQSHPLANLPLVASILLAMIGYSLPPGPANTAIQFAKAGVCYALAGLWVWLRLPDLIASNRRHVLLWVLLPAWGVASAHHNLPNYGDQALTVSILIATLLLLGYSTAGSPRRTLRAVSLAVIFIVLIVPGGLLAILGGVQWLTGRNEPDGSYELLEWRLAATHENHAIAAVIGLAAMMLGWALLALLKRIRSP